MEGIRALADLCQGSGVFELEASDGDWSVRLRIDRTAAAALPTPAVPSGDESAQTGVHVVHSGWVGVFHRAIDGESAPYVQEGQVVRDGDVVGVIEAMQLQHEQRSDRDGTIIRFLVDDDTPVEYGQPLLEIG